MSVIQSARLWLQDKLQLSRPKTFKEIGHSGITSGKTGMLSTYNNDNDRVDSISISDYRKMWRNDGKVAAILKLYSMPIMSADYEIVPAKNDNGEADFIRDNLLAPKYGGGMSTPIKKVFEDMSYVPFEGIRTYEKVWYEYGSQIRLRKLAPRDPVTITVKTDKQGGFDGFEQDVGDDSFEIPRDKALSIVYGAAEDPLYGMSMLKSAWYHWDKKHKLYYIAHVASEVQTIPPRIIKHQGLEANVLSALELAVDRLGLESRVTYRGDMAEVELLDTNSGKKVDLKSMIDHHDSQISKSCLAMWIDLSSEMGSTGSRALAEPQLDVFFQNVDSVLSLIETGFTDYVFPQLITWNFASKAVPRLKFESTRRDVRTLMRETFSELVKNQQAPQEFVTELVNKVAGELGVEFDVEKAKESIQPEEEQEQATPVVINQSPQVDVPVESNEQPIRIVDLVDEVGTSRLDLQEITSKLRASASTMERELSDILTSSKDSITNRMQALVERKDYKSMNDLKLPNYEEYVKTYQDGVRDFYEFSKVKASEELDVKTPPTTSSATDRIETKSTQVSEKQFRDLIFELIALGLIAIDQAMTPAQIAAAIDILYAQYVAQKIIDSIWVSLVEFMNKARDDVFAANLEFISAFKYTNSIENIIRGVVCPYCQSLNGMVVDITDDAYHNFMPPNHFRCACAWEPLKKGDKFSITGPPSGIPIYDTINEFRQIDKGEINTHREEMGLTPLKLGEITHDVGDLKEMVSKLNEKIDLQEKQDSINLEEITKLANQLLDESKA